MKKKDLKYSILVIGSGGTGTYFLKEFTRYYATNPAIWSSIASITVADGDTVENKNLARQCFGTDDIGANKAAVFCEALNDMVDDLTENTKGKTDLHYWNAYTRYITKYSQLNDIFNGNHTIPVIIGAVDNDACRILCEEWFAGHDNCYYFDSGNEFSSGECVYAYKEDGVVLSPTKSFYYPIMKEGDLTPVDEMSCEELNQSAPQHILTNMFASVQLLGGMMILLDPKRTSENNKRLGYSFFDSFDCINEFTPYKPEMARS